MKKEKISANNTRFNSNGTEIKNIQFQIVCPKCKSENCFCESYYTTGVKAIDCPDCDHYRKLIHKKDENGRFIWTGETEDSTIDNLVSDGILFDDTFAVFFIDISGGGGECGQLKAKNDYDNFLSYIESLSKQKHNMKKVTVVSLADNSVIIEFVFENAA
ncbi:hypothetical protein ACFLZA_02970 [Candidatus Neomarinimicrobiota bacterium]